MAKKDSLARHKTLAPLMLSALALAVCGGGGGSQTSPSPKTASPFYVSTTGNDANAGTSAAPWRTLRYGVSRLTAGDTLYIRGGTYGGGSNYDYRIADDTITIPSGTSFSNAVTIAGYPGEAVTIQTPADGNDVIHLATTSHQ